MRMRCLTLRQPWLHFIFEIPLGTWKNIENRKSSVTNTMGPCLFSASLKTDEAYHIEACDTARAKGIPEELIPKYGSLPTGGIVGAVRFDELLPPWGLFDQLYPWKFSKCYGYVLGARLKLPFRKPKEKGQGIFYVTLTAEEERLLGAAGLLP